MVDTPEEEYPTPDYIEPMLLAAQPYTLSGNRDSTATVAWAVANALEAAGYVVVPIEPTEAMNKEGADAAAMFGNAGAVYRAMIAAYLRTQQSG